MKILILALTIAAGSCETASKEKLLLGSWTIRQDESKYPKSGITDGVTFLSNDSFKVEI